MHTYTNSYHKKLSKKEQRRRDYVRNAPKNRFKRILWRLNPKNTWGFLQTREGRIFALKLAGGAFAFFILLVGGVYAFYKSELPSPDEVNGRIQAQTTQFYDRKGETLLFEVYGDQNRTVVEQDEISEHMLNATVAIEDKEFYNHGGFSVRGITRAFINNITSSDGSVQGGSTITQQYIKNALLTSDQRIERKVKELILSIELERLYSKDEILTAYLNEIPYGSLEYGVEAASQSFFDKPAKDLTPDEAALLAAIPQAPTRYSPYNEDTSLLLARQDTVLTSMEKEGYLSAKEAKEAKEVDTLAKLNRNRNKYAGIIAPHFVLEAQKELEDKYTAPVVNQSGWKVITSLDLELQQTAEKVAAENIDRVENMGGDNLALALGDQDNGQILAMVGSRDFEYPEYGAFNAATAPRQPGSSFKPYAYAELFETGKWGPGSILYDLQTDFGGGYIPKNFNTGQFSGAITVRRALGQSLNIPAVKALYIAGMDNTLDQAGAQGITTLEDRSRFGLSVVLGAGEVKLADHVTGYEAFANGGIHYDQTYVLKIEAPDGEVIEDNTKPKGKRVLNEEVAYLVTDMMADRNVRFGALNAVNVNTAIKTGTTSDVKDFWTMGFSNHITGGVWVGNHDNKRMAFGASSLSIAPIFTSLMNEVHEVKGWESEEFKRPDGLKTVTLDSDTGKPPTDATTRTHTDIFSSNYTSPTAGKEVSYTIDTISGKLATDCTPESTKKTVTGDGIEPEIPESDPSYSRWAAPIRGYAAGIGRSFGGAAPTETDDVHNCSDTLPSVNSISVSPSGSNYQISASVSGGTHGLQSISFNVDGAEVSNQAISGSGIYSATVALAAGSHSIVVNVTDAAGYVGSDSTNTTTTSFSANSPSGTSSSPVTFSWSQDSSASSYIVRWSGTSNGSKSVAGQSNTSTVQSLPSGSYSWYVESYSGGGFLRSTNTLNFTIP